MKWTKELPKIEGAYWFRNLDVFFSCPDTVIMIRVVGNELLMDNCDIAQSKFYTSGEWAGPIPKPIILVQCNKAKEYRCGLHCPHAQPHEEIQEQCGTSPCGTINELARCIEITE